MKVIRAFLAVDCPMDEHYIKFKSCKRCMFNDYEALTEYAIECTFAVGDKV